MCVRACVSAVRYVHYIRRVRKRARARSNFFLLFIRSFIFSIATLALCSLLCFALALFLSVYLCVLRLFFAYDHNWSCVLAVLSCISQIQFIWRIYEKRNEVKQKTRTVRGCCYQLVLTCEITMRATWWYIIEYNTCMQNVRTPRIEKDFFQ